MAPRARSSAPPLKSLRRVVELLEALERREGELLARAKGMTAVKNALLDSHRFKLECSIEALSGVVEEVVKPVSVKDTCDAIGADGPGAWSGLFCLIACGSCARRRLFAAPASRVRGEG